MGFSQRPGSSSTIPVSQTGDNGPSEFSFPSKDPLRFFPALREPIVAQTAFVNVLLPKCITVATVGELDGLYDLPNEVSQP